MYLLRFISSLALSTVLLGLAGCSSLSITAPVASGPALATPVTINGTFRANVSNSLVLELDGVDITNSGPFHTTIDYAAAPGVFSATVPAGTMPNGIGAGAHTLVVRGDFADFLSPVRQRSEQVTFTVAGPALSFTPANVTLIAGATASVTVNISQPQSSPVTVNLSTAPTGRVGVPATATIPANATASSPVTLTALASGDATLTASATNISSANLSASVNPGLTAVAPAQGPVGTVVTFTGSGFASGATVRFGTANSPTVTVLSATSLTATVPAGLANGGTNARVTVANNNSTTRPFTVSAPPVVPPAAVLFRTSAQDVQTFTFTAAAGATPASFALVDTDGATAQGGVFTVGIAQTPTTVVRSSPADVQAFAIGAPPSLALTGTRGGGLSGTGSAVAISGTTVVRAIDSGIQVGVLNAGAIGVLANASGSPSATGVAVDIRGTLVVRAHSGGIDLFDVSNPAAPIRLSGAGTGGGDASAVGTGVRFVSATLVVRSIPQGIELYDVSTPASPTRVGVNRTGVVDAAMGTAVAVEPGGAAVIRATSLGLERYLLTPANLPPLVSSRSGRVSTTGVGVVVVGTRVFRATNDRLEAYDLPALGPLVADIPATVSAVGVGLAGR